MSSQNNIFFLIYVHLFYLLFSTWVEGQICKPDILFMKNIISLSGMNMVGRPLILKMALLHDLEMLNDSNSPSLKRQVMVSNKERGQDRQR